MKNYKQLIAGAMAAIMVLGSSVVALADEGSVTGQGSLDIVEKSDIFDVILPTVVDEFDYILDPEGVIKESNFAKYGTSKFETDQTLYFFVSDGDSNDYRHTSEAMTVTNKSTMDVDITVKASVTAVDGITMVSDGNATQVTGGDAKLYLGLVDKTNTQTKAITVEGVEVTATIAGSADQYEVKYVTDGDSGYYTKELKSNATGFKTFQFGLEGACSKSGWGDIATVTPPEVTVVWTVENPTGPQVTLSKAGVITMSGLTAERNYAHSALLGYDGTSTQLDTDPNMEWGLDSWSAETGGTLTFKLNQAWLDAIKGFKVTITVSLSDGTTIECSQQF